MRNRAFQWFFMYKDNGFMPFVRIWQAKSHAKDAKVAEIQSKLRCRWSSRWLRATENTEGKSKRNGQNDSSKWSEYYEYSEYSDFYNLSPLNSKRYSPLVHQAKAVTAPRSSSHRLSFNIKRYRLTFCYFRQKVVPLHPFKEKKKKRQWLDI